MHTAVRPWVTNGIAIVGAGVIAIVPVQPVPTFDVPEIRSPAVQLTQLQIPELLTFPAFRQFIVNQIGDLIIYGAGFAQSGAALANAITLIPETLRLLTQQVLSHDFVGALNTITHP